MKIPLESNLFQRWLHAGVSILALLSLTGCLGGTEAADAIKETMATIASATLSIR